MPQQLVTIIALSDSYAMTSVFLEKIGIRGKNSQNEINSQIQFNTTNTQNVKLRLWCITGNERLMTNIANEYLKLSSNVVIISNCNTDAWVETLQQLVISSHSTFRVICDRYDRDRCNYTYMNLNQVTVKSLLTFIEYKPNKQTKKQTKKTRRLCCCCV